jgi:hypothetical protein
VAGALPAGREAGRRLPAGRGPPRGDRGRRRSGLRRDAIALLIGPTLGGGGHIERLLIVEAILAPVAAAILAWGLRVPAPNEGWDEERAAVEGRAVRALWVKPQMRNMAGLVFVGSVHASRGPHRHRWPNPPRPRHPDRRPRRDGFVLLPAFPIILTAAERLSGPTQAAIAGALVWRAGNLGSLVVALVVQALVHHPTAAFVAMAALSLPALWLAERFRPPVPASSDAVVFGQPDQL